MTPTPMTPERWEFLWQVNERQRHFHYAYAKEALVELKRRMDAETEAAQPRRAALEVWRGLNAAQTKEQ